jgi:O-antigen/teichoic acid export membrane protein
MVLTKNLISAVSVLVATEAICILLIYIILRNDLKIRWMGNWTSESWKRIKEGFPLGITSMAGIVTGKLDVIALGLYDSPSNLGAYALLVRLQEPFQFVGGALFTSIFAALSSASLVQNNSRELLQRYTKIVLAFGVCAAIVYGLISVLTVRYLQFRSDNQEIIVSVLAFGIIVRSYLWGTTAVFYGLGDFSPVTKMAVLNLLIALVLFPALAAVWFGPGIAIGVVLVDMGTAIAQGTILYKTGTRDHRSRRGAR